MQTCMLINLPDVKAQQLEISIVHEGCRSIETERNRLAIPILLGLNQ